MSNWRRQVLAVVTCAVACASVAASPAAAEDPSSSSDADRLARTAAKPGWITNKSPLPGISESTWAELVGPTQDPWRPKGDVIAASKFVPKRDGFHFLNYANIGSSLPNEVNKYVFGGNYSNVKNMRAQQMINLFGRSKVCLGHKKNKPASCVLTPSARAWMDAINRVSGGGHCFGIATVAAQLFNGQLPQTALGGRSTTNAIPFKPPATEVIAQAFSLQSLVSAPDVQPRRAIKMLKRGLKKGRIPFTLTMSATGGGGHAVTPIAVTRTGKGKYDIAIYDNNYPDRIRAIHADANFVPGTRRQAGFDYELFTLPGKPPVDLVGPIKLWEVNKLQGSFKCPFCAGAKNTTVHLKPVMTETPVDVSVTAPDGSKIRGLRVVKPSNPWLPGSPQTLPSFHIPRGKAFKLVIDNGANTQPVETIVAVESGELTWAFQDYVLPAGTRDSIEISPKSGAMTFATSQGSSPAAAVVDHSTPFNPREILVGPEFMAPGSSFSTRTRIRKGVFTFTPGAGSSTGGAILLTQQRGGSTVRYSTTGTPLPLNVPVGSQLEFDYLAWKVSAPRVEVDVVAAGGPGVGQWLPLQRGTA